jgi:hypothetical protein
VSVLGGVTIGSSVFQPNVDDKDMTDTVWGRFLSKEAELISERKTETQK